MRGFPPQPIVLVIDDDPDVLTQIATVLRSAGYTCRCSNTPEAALALARRILPDLVICDMHPGGQSGLELCQQIKADPNLRSLPFMFLSGTQMPDIIRRPHDAGGAYHVRKPLDPDVLMKLVDRALWKPERRVPLRAKRTASSTS